MRRLLLILLVLLAAVPIALGARSSGGDLPFSPVGQQQKIAVVWCSYAGTSPDDTDITARTWARVLNDKLNDYYKTATGNKVSFKFLPATRDCPLDDRYAETKPLELPGGNFTLENDPATIFREAGQAVLFADEHLGIDHPWAGIDINRLLVIVNRPKRGRATIPPGIYFQTGSSGPKNITVSVVSVDQKGRAQAPLARGSGRDNDFEGVVTDKDIALIAHELGHQLGLPDLYQDDATKSEYTEFWDEMANDNLQNFSAFSRYVTGWLRPSQYQIVNSGTPAAGIEVTINPPLTGGTEAVLLPTGGPIVPQPPGVAYSAPFQGYILEARSHTGLDASRPTLYADGQPSSLFKFCMSMGTPASYADGVLVGATIGNRETFFPANPYTVKARTPRTPGYKCNSDDAAKFDKTELSGATYGPDSTFFDRAVNLSVKVLSKTENGGYKVRIIWNAPPTAPNLVATDAWLDSSANGFGTFWTPDNDHDGAPDLFGDPVYTPASVSLSLTAPPQITTSTTIHRLSLKVQNSGDETAHDVRGTAYILGGEIPVGADLNADTLGRSSVARVLDIRFGDIEPGASVTKTVEVTPAGPFVVALLINKDTDELNVADNLRIEPFLTVQTGSGSPYKPIDLSLALSNLNKRGAALYASPYPLPAGWRGTLDAGAAPGRSYALLKGGAGEKFRLQLQPPDPSVAKPGQVKEIALTGFMNQGDTFIPTVKIPVAVVLSYGTALTLTARPGSGKTSLDGQLTYRDGGRDKPLGGAQVRVAISAAGGGEKPRSELSAKTDARGTLTVTVKTLKGARYGAVAEYTGSLRYLAKRSDAVAFGGTAAAATSTAATTTTAAPAVITPKAYGVADDTGKFADDGGKAFAASLKGANLSVSRWTLVWSGSSTPARDPFLDKAVPVAVNAGVEIILALFPNPTSPPLPLQAGFADSFCTWAANVARSYPQIKRFIVGNEVNAARFWPQTGGGVAVYYDTLKTCYDRLKAVGSGIQVIGMGLAPRAVSRPASTAPLDFVRAIGAAYRADGRATPIMDALAIHPYPNPSAKPPPPPARGGYEDAAFFGAPQLDRVKAALTTAFGGTAQPTAANGLSLVIDEYGYQTETTGDARYTGTEVSGVVSEADQAAYYATAITTIFACDPAVSDVLLFLLVDEQGRGVTEDGGGWQSGLQRPDGSRKPSYDAVATAVKAGCSR